MVTSIRFNVEDAKNIDKIKRDIYLKTGINVKNTEIIKMCIKAVAQTLNK